MVINEKVYTPWAFTENECEKQETNIRVYNKYRHLINEEKEIKSGFINIRKCDNLYGRNEYTVVTDIQCPTSFLAVMCDNGNACFGYSLERRFNDTYVVTIFTD